ncbi:MAG: signal recognition particle-docking protein FtsY [Candidatus Babeliales bacterium]
MFNILKNTFGTIFSQFNKIQGLFSRTSIDEKTMQELEQLLIEADTGIQTTRVILTNLKEKFRQGIIKQGEDLKKALELELVNLLKPFTHSENRIYLLVGINGSGKTTGAAKLAYQYQQQGKKVLLVAGDTFRAAASDQLKQWAEKVGVNIVCGKENQDPGSVVFAGCEQFKKDNYDILIIDTAGRLQTKINLMHELAKIKKIILKQFPTEPITTLLTLDAMLGQNSLEQAKVFHDCTKINGIVLSKMDGTGKGGIVFAINETLQIPVAYIAHGEKKEDLKQFNPPEYVQQLIAE